MSQRESLKELVRRHYTKAVTRPAGGGGCCTGGKEPVVKEAGLLQIAGYRREEISSLPEEAVGKSFGCGNPVAFAGVRPGQVVVDIGSGAGMDCLLAAEKVGPEGRVIGLDMTPAMIEKARANARAAGKHNVEFRLGDAEAMPLENGSADWIVSNCVINLAPDKKKVFREAFRVLRPGGRLSVSDIVARIPRPLRVLSLYASCLSGALPEEDYLAAVAEAGFREVRVVARHVYDLEQLAVLFGKDGFFSRVALRAARSRLGPLANRALRRVSSIQLVAVKPAAWQAIA